MSMLMMTVPIFYPIITALGFDAIWFGIYVILVMNFGSISPPVGMCCFVVKGIDKGISLGTVFKGIIAFIFALFETAMKKVAINKISGQSIVGAYEISQCALMCAVFASFAYGQLTKTHITMTLIIERLPGRAKFIPFFPCSAVSTVMAAILTYATSYQAGRQVEAGRHLFHGR